MGLIGQSSSNLDLRVKNQRDSVVKLEQVSIETPTNVYLGRAQGSEEPFLIESGKVKAGKFYFDFGHPLFEVFDGQALLRFRFRGGEKAIDIKASLVNAV
ncbi:MAG: hypothetical protein ACR2KU_14320 [Gammaproteobacteria bacterium]